MNNNQTVTDFMSPVERTTAMQNGEPFDRYPCHPNISEMKPGIIGISTHDFWYNPEKMAEAELTAYTMFHYDSITIGPNTHGITEALGGVFTYPESECPFIKTPFLKSYDELVNLQAFNALTHPRMYPFSEEVNLLKGKLGNTVEIVSHIGGPFTIAANLRGIEFLLRDCYKCPENVMKLLRIIVDSQKSCIDWATANGLSICMADPVASSDLIGPKLYEKFVYPFTKELTDYAYKKTGKKVYLHMCGKSYSIWKYFKDYSLLALSLDNCINLEEAINTFGDDFIVTGNIDPVGIIMQGTKKDIYTSVKNCIETGRKCRKGFIVATGCDVPSVTPLEHIEWFMDAVRKYS